MSKDEKRNAIKKARIYRKYLKLCKRYELDTQSVDNFCSGPGIPGDYRYRYFLF